ncbi:MAG: DUF1284 domain-containing protein [Lachnospiraceae bacterium]|nr:DUF1284 domain-containing protein [Lachnospiraceae bacterium]
MKYRIRAHHGMCFSFFQGKGYSGEFTENMWKMKERLSQNPEVVLLCRTDDVCACCPNNHEGACESLEKVEDYDRQVLALCGLKENAVLRWHDFAALVQENIISAGRRESVCGGCEWNELCQ